MTSRFLHTAVGQMARKIITIFSDVPRGERTNMVLPGLLFPESPNDLFHYTMARAQSWQKALSNGGFSCSGITS